MVETRENACGVAKAMSPSQFQEWCKWIGIELGLTDAPEPAGVRAWNRSRLCATRRGVRMVQLTSETGAEFQARVLRRHAKGLI